MIRPFTLITMALAALSGAYLFAVKHQAQVLDDQLAVVAQNSRLDQQRIRVLQAQWALEIDPTRLAGLAQQFTSLQPMKPAQLVTLAALRAALPPAGSAAPGSNPAGSAPTTPADAALGVASALPLPPSAVMPPVALASLSTPPPVDHLVPHVAARARPKHTVSHLGNVYAENLPPPRPMYTPMTPVGAQIVTVRAAAIIAPASAGSALGMTADLAPPRPLPAGADN